MYELYELSSEVFHVSARDESGQFASGKIIEIIGVAPYREYRILWSNGNVGHVDESMLAVFLRPVNDQLEIPL